MEPKVNEEFTVMVVFQLLVFCASLYPDIPSRIDVVQWRIPDVPIKIGVARSEPNRVFGEPAADLWVIHLRGSLLRKEGVNTKRTCFRKVGRANATGIIRAWQCKVPTFHQTSA